MIVVISVNIIWRWWNGSTTNEYAPYGRYGRKTFLSFHSATQVHGTVIRYFIIQHSYFIDTILFELTVLQACVYWIQQ